MPLDLTESGEAIFIRDTTKPLAVDANRVEP